MNFKKNLPKVGIGLMIVGLLITLYDILIRTEKKELFESLGMLVFAIGMVIVFFPKKQVEEKSDWK